MNRDDGNLAELVYFCVFIKPRLIYLNLLILCDVQKDYEEK